MFTSFNARAVGLSLPAVETVQLAASARFDGVDLLVRDIVDESKDDPHTLRARMDDLGLRGGAWPLPMEWRGIEERFQLDLDRLPELAATAAILGLNRTGTWVMPETPEFPSSPGLRKQHWREVFDLHVRRLSAIARVLDEHGTRLGIEVIGAESSRSGRGMPFLQRLGSDEMGALLGAIDRPNVGVLVDSFHLYAAGEQADAVLAARGVGNVVWVHVADLPQGASRDRGLIQDSRRGLPGENGTIDSGALLRRLAMQGYDGPVTAEPLAGRLSLEALSVESAVSKVAESLRLIWPGSRAHE